MEISLDQGLVRMKGGTQGATVMDSNGREKSRPLSLPWELPQQLFALHVSFIRYLPYVKKYFVLGCLGGSVS